MNALQPARTEDSQTITIYGSKYILGWDSESQRWEHNRNADHVLYTLAGTPSIDLVRQMYRSDGLIWALNNNIIASEQVYALDTLLRRVLHPCWSSRTMHSYPPDLFVEVLSVMANQKLWAQSTRALRVWSCGIHATMPSDSPSPYGHINFKDLRKKDHTFPLVERQRLLHLFDQMTREKHQQVNHSSCSLSDFFLRSQCVSRLLPSLGLLVQDYYEDVEVVLSMCDLEELMHSWSVTTACDVLSNQIQSTNVLNAIIYQHIEGAGNNHTSYGGLHSAALMAAQHPNSNAVAVMSLLGHCVEFDNLNVLLDALLVLRPVACEHQSQKWMDPNLISCITHVIEHGAQRLDLSVLNRSQIGKFLRIAEFYNSLLELSESDFVRMWESVWPVCLWVMTQKYPPLSDTKQAFRTSQTFYKFQYVEGDIIDELEAALSCQRDVPQHQPHQRYLPSEYYSYESQLTEQLKTLQGYSDERLDAWELTPSERAKEYISYAADANRTWMLPIATTNIHSNCLQ